MMDSLNNIYKYTALDFALKIATTSTLKFTNPSKFNDPFDCDISRLNFDLSTANESINNEIEYLKRRFNSNPALTPELFERGYKESQINKIKRASVCCFSFTSNNILMWAHYADKHYGACLIFDNLVENKFSNIPDSRLTTVPVNYKPFNEVNYFENKLEAIRNLFGTKSIEWEYENEYRIVILEPEGIVKFNPQFLTGIIFGLKVSDEEIDNFINTCKKQYLNLSFKRAVRCQDRLEVIEM